MLALLLFFLLSPADLPAQPTTHLLADAETAIRQLAGFSYTVWLECRNDHIGEPETYAGRVTFERKAPRDYPYRFLLESDTERVVYDGERVAWRDLTNGMESSIVAQAFRTDCGVPWTISTQPLLRVTFPELADRLRMWRQSSDAVVEVTKELLDGVRTLHLSITEAAIDTPDREHHDLYLALDTRLPVRYRRTREDRCGSQTLTADFSELVTQRNEEE